MNLTTLSPTMPAILTPIQLVLTKLREETAQKFVSLPADASLELTAQWEAQVNHSLTVNLGYQERLTGAAKAYMLWQAKETEFWRSVAIPLIDPDGKPISGEFRRFKDFDEYMDYILNEWGMSAPSSVSNLKNTVLFLLPGCQTGLILDPDTGEIVTPEDVLMLDEHMRQFLVTVANRVFNPKVTKGEAKPIETIGQALSIINDSGSVTEAATRLQAAKLIGNESGDTDQFTVYTYMDQNIVYVGMALTPGQHRKLLLMLSKKAEPASVLSIDAMFEEMKALTPSVVENNHANADPDDFTGFLAGQSR